MTPEPLHFHVDIDAFYASVEQVDRPELRGMPVVVGALPGHRGVVSACSYEARKFGVHSAMPVSQAYRLCPSAAYLPVRMRRYTEVSETVMAILREAAPVFQQISIDEAALDLSGTERLLGAPLAVARDLKDRVRLATGLTISVGIGPNRYVAKLASERGKPDGLLRVCADEAEAFIGGLGLGELWGVGEKTLQRLHDAGFHSVADVRALPRDALEARLGSGCGGFLARVVRGEDPGIHATEIQSHSLSTERTLERDTADAEILRLLILELSQAVAERLLRERLTSQIVTLKLRTEDFVTVTARKSLSRPVESGSEIAALAMALLRRRWDGRTPVRLLGVGLAQVEDGEGWAQGELLDDPRGRSRRVEETVARLKGRHEGITLTRASLLPKAGDRRSPPGGAPAPT